MLYDILIFIITAIVGLAMLGAVVLFLAYIVLEMYYFIIMILASFSDKYRARYKEIQNAENRPLGFWTTYFGGGG